MTVLRVMILCGSIQATFFRLALNFGVLPLCLLIQLHVVVIIAYLRCCQIWFETVNGPFLVRRPCHSGNTAVSILLDIISSRQQGVVETNAR